VASAAAPKVTVADLSTCKALATALNVDVTGHTVFCPTNHVSRRAPPGAPRARHLARPSGMRRRAPGRLAA
jgi:hypothetical protein